MPTTPDVLVSVVIPYKQRLHNLRIALETLAAQTMDSARFEVVVGAMEYCPEYLATCREFTGRITIISVLVEANWNTSRARNVAFRQASGQVIVFLDADMAVPPAFLQNLYDRYYAHHQNVCVAGLMMDYNTKRDVDVPEAVSYERCREILAVNEARPSAPEADERWRPDYAQAVLRFPWALVRTAIAVAPRALIERHGLLFDEAFQGWGGEDQEWAFRVSRTGTPILLCPDVYGLHLPHRRDTAANDAAARANNRYYLRKWPRLDLELVLAFGFRGAAKVYGDVERELAAAAGSPRYCLGVVRGITGGRDALLIGATLDAGSLTPTADVDALFDDRRVREVHPLAGFSLPHEDRSVEQCRILPPVTRLSQPYRDAILRAAERVCADVVAPAAFS